MSDVVHIETDRDVLHARQKGRLRARALGFGLADQTRIATAISELARNALRYAGTGTCTFYDDRPDPLHIRLTVVVEDSGPGIPDIEEAMQDGFSSGSGMGAGLPGTRRLVHEFDIQSRPGRTQVTIAMITRIAVNR